MSMTIADAPAETPADKPGEDEGADDAGSLFALAEQADTAIQKDDAGKAIKPDWISDQFWDAAKGEVKVAELAKSQRDLRAQISRGEHKPPESPDKYAVPVIEGLPEGLIGGKDDALWPEVTKAAHAAGLTQQQLAAIAAPVLKQMAATQAEADPAAQEQAARQAAEAELAKLGPNATMVMKDIAGWLNGMHANGTITREELAAARGMSSAAGIRLLGKLRELGGEKPIPTDMLDTGAMTPAEASRLMEEGFAENNQAKVAKGRAFLDELDRKGIPY